jgi:hypothetical protein
VDTKGEKDSFLAVMEKEQKPSLASLLAGQEAGTWVVLTADMSRILSTASTPEEAIEKAHIPPPTSDKAVGERPVMVQVPDPTMACFF